MDDRFTGYDADSIARMGFDGGKMLFRIDPDDPATVVTMEACARAVSGLASHALMAMVEPFISHRLDGRVRNDLSPEAVIRSITVAAGLGTTSAYTWLKLPVVDDMERVLAASMLPVLLLGGEVSADQDAAFERWRKALQIPSAARARHRPVGALPARRRRGQRGGHRAFHGAGVRSEIGRQVLPEAGNEPERRLLPRGDPPNGPAGPTAA